MTQSLSEILDSSNNSFNLVRLTAALAVIVSHSFALQTGHSSFEPLIASTPFTLGQHAVNAFFVISGLTLSQSIQRNPDLVDYAWARCLRIFPALLAFGVLFAFFAGPFLTTLRLSEYFADAHTYLYPVAVLVQFSKAVPPHEIFSTSLFPYAANDPLWTIKYELAAYIGLAVFFLLGVHRRPSVLFAALVVTSTIMMAIGPLPHEESSYAWLYNLGRYGFCFLVGVLAFHFRYRFPLSLWLLLPSIALVALLGHTVLRQVAYIMLTAHLVFIAGAQSYGQLTTFTRKTDLSYGAYIYGWPIQQTIVTVFPGVSVGWLLALSLATVPWFALASWNFVEKPALRLKSLDPRALLSRFHPT